MMFARIHKRLSYLLPGTSSFLREFHVSLSLELQACSTSRESKFQPDANTTITEILPGKKPERSKPVLLFLKEYGFSDTELEKMMKSRKQFLSANMEKSIKPKFKIFQDWGFCVADVVEIIRKEPLILCSNTSTRFIPSLTALKGLLGSNEKVVKVLRRCSWFFQQNLDTRMWPNIEFLRTCGIPMKHVLDLLSMHPRLLLLNPETVRKRVEKVSRFTVDPSSKMYIHAFVVSCGMTDKVWELKLRAFRELGFSETDILTAFKKAPQVFASSTKKTKRVAEVILATKRYTISSIVPSPASLGSSIDKRIKPRFQVLESLEKRNLIKKWPGLSSVCTYTDETFREKFVAPYLNETGLEDSGKTAREKDIF